MALIPKILTTVEQLQKLGPLTESNIVSRWINQQTFQPTLTLMVQGDLYQVEMSLVLDAKVEISGS